MNPKKKPEGFLVIPKGEHQCLWMMAGVVAYKLCEREYQCERCPLHMEMRHAKAEAVIHPAGSIETTFLSKSKTFSAAGRHSPGKK